MKPLPPMAMASRIANIDLPETPPLRTREVVSNVMLTTLGDVVSVKLGAVQLTPAGAGLGATQARVMVPLKPLTALNVSGTLTKLPAATVTLVVVLPLAGQRGWRTEPDRVLITSALYADRFAYAAFLRPAIAALA